MEKEQLKLHSENLPDVLMVMNSTQRQRSSQPEPKGRFIVSIINEETMKTQRNILTAFLLNLAFSIFEFAGGIWSGSTAILSDAVHDLGDAAGIGVSWYLEKLSRRKPDEKYTYGYVRYSVLGAIITTVILFFGSLYVIVSAIEKIIHPTPINYNGMIALSLIGLAVNAAAAWFTREGDSLNQKAVNLHMLEDVLGWAVVLAGSILMRFTDISIIDPLMSIGVSLFILIEALRTFRASMVLFLEKAPENISADQIEKKLEEIPGVLNVHHIHVWSLDGENNLATLHVKTDDTETGQLRKEIRDELSEMGISHSTIEIETPEEECSDAVCHPVSAEGKHTGHHHHH